MKIIKTKGIVIREVNFKDNDKIITLLSPDLGKISCFARGARKTNSTLLSCSQFLVYSEFILYKGQSFYNINSGDVIDTFYDLRIDYDKLEYAFEISKMLNSLIEEDSECKNILPLFLNTLFVIKENKYDSKLIVSIFKLKLMTYLGYAPNIMRCSECNEDIKDENADDYYFIFATGGIICNKCFDKLKPRYGQELNKNMILLKESTLFALKYVILSDNKKLFSFKLSDSSQNEFINYIKVIFSMTFSI